MRILITNDDGIRAEGIRILTEAVQKHGDHEIWIVAPADQCSAMSQRITLREKLLLKQEDYPLAGVRAWSVSGTPADCVKVALACVMKECRPDVIFTGMNFGYNSGFDIIYSGTVAAAMEGIMHGIPSYAFSNEAYVSNELAIERLPELISLLLEKEPDLRGIWNVNIPGCSPEECKGIKWYTKPAAVQYYEDHYEAEKLQEGELLSVQGIPIGDEAIPDGTDIAALRQGYISIGRVENMILGVDYDRR